MRLGLSATIVSLGFLGCMVVAPLDDVVEDEDERRPQRGGNSSSDAGDGNVPDPDGGADATGGRATGGRPGNGGTPNTGGTPTTPPGAGGEDTGPEPPPEAICGDGVCDVDEDTTNCCDDCGCSDDEVCDNSLCVPACDTQTFTLENTIESGRTFSTPECGSFPADTFIYVTDGTDVAVMLPGETLSIPVAQGDSIQLQYQCCYVAWDPYTECFIDNTCATPDGSTYNCTCTTTAGTINGTANSCEEVVDTPICP